MVLITVAGLALPLKPTEAGPLLASDQLFWEPLAHVVNAAVTGALPQLAERLEYGQDAIVQGLFAARPQPGEDLAEPRAHWKQWTGTDAGDDVYVVGTTFTPHEVVIPRRALQQILEELTRLREEAMGES